MILAIDIGNTHITLGCMESGNIVHVFTLSSNVAKTSDEYFIDMKNMLEFHLIDFFEIEGAIISCVVPPLMPVIRDAVNKLTQVNAIIVGAGVKTGMNILIDDPAQLGGDMVAAAVGALAAYTPPIIVADLGTATKMYVIDEAGSFIGGIIAPGLSLSMAALSEGTSQLPHVPIEAPAKCISKNTTDCMKSGAVFGTASMIDGMVTRFESELGRKATAVITGGLAEIIYPHCAGEIIFDRHLLLRGLGVIFEKNNRK